MKPKYNTSKFRNQTFGASLVTAISICFGGSAFATVWDGETSQDWNDITNWAGNNGTAGSNAIINTSTGNFPIISADFIAATSPVDIMVGEGPGNSGLVNHTSGLASTGANNWMFVGRDGATGTYNLTGDGSLNVGGTAVGGRLFIGGSAGTGSTGVFNMNTSGTLNVRNQMQIGTNNSVGELNLDAGIINAGTAGGDGDWFEIGNGGGSTGTINMTGGSIVKGGSEHFIVGANGANGFLNISGGSINVNNETWVANNAGSVGVLNLSGSGSITSNSWVAIGRSGGASATVNMTGGTWTKTTGAATFIVGSSGPATMDQSGGLVDVQGPSGLTWVGEAAGATTAVLTIRDTAEFRSAIISVGPQGPNATLNLQGGIVRTRRFTGQRVDGGSTAETGNGTLNFEGSQIIASAAATDFMANIDVASTNTAQGLRVDSNGFNLTAAQVISGPGGMVKSGLGTFTLTGANTYLGTTLVEAGKVATSTSQVGGGALTVADGAAFGLNVNVNNSQFNASDVVLADSAAGVTLDFNLGGFTGNATNAPLNVTGALVLNGPVTVNVTDSFPVAGKILLLKYTPGNRSGSGSFVLGSEPLGVNLAVPGVVTEDTGTGEVYLDVASVALPRWEGNVNGVWDIATTANWIDQISLTASTYSDGSPVLFNDALAGTSTTDVVLNTTVTPDLVTFNHSARDYSLTGTGKITGPTALVKNGTGTLVLSTNANDYTGPTSILGGRLTISSIANGGVASAIGASSASASNLVISGGLLNYTGVSVTSDRGFTIGGVDSTLTTLNNLELSGSVASTGGSFVKNGGGNLVLSNAGANVLGASGQTNRVVLGTLTFQGSGTQTFSIPGAFHVGTAGGTTAVVVNNSAVTIGGFTEIGISDNATSTLTVSGTGNLTVGRFLTARGINASATITIRDSAVLNKTSEFLSLGLTNNGQTLMTVQDNAQVISTSGDFNIADTGTSQATLTITGNGSVSHNGAFYVGKNAGTNGAVNVNGGSLTMGGNNEVFIGARAPGVLNQTAGVVNSSGWTVVGRYNVVGTNGQLNVSGGTFNQTQIDRGLIIGEEGPGTMTVSGTGVVNANRDIGIVIANGSTGVGIVNLNVGGTISTKGVRKGSSGSATFNFNGGTLIAATGSTANFMAGLDTTFVDAAGGTIDTNGNNISWDVALSGAGTLTKNGAGALYLNSFSSHTGLIQINTGTLGGTGFLSGGSVAIGAGADLNPGVTFGTLSVQNITFGSGSTLTIDAAAAGDTLAVLSLGNVNLNNANLVFNGPLTQAEYVIVDYSQGTKTGSFASVPTLPAGYTYLDDGARITISRPQTAFETWAETNITNINPSADASPGGDPDGDGMTNSAEFGLNGNPLSGASSGKVVSRIANVGGAPSLVLSLPVRAVPSPPSFTGSPNKQVSSLVSGLRYTIEGSDSLASWNVPVTEVTGGDKTAIESTLPAMGSSEWTYRTFTTGPVSGGARDFMRIIVEQP